MEPFERRQRAMEALHGCRISGKKKDRKKRTKRLEFRTEHQPEMSKKMYNQCAKKHRYRTQADATRHMHVIQVIRPEKPLRVYGPCPYCGGYHLTSKPERNVRKKFVRL